MTSCRCYKNSIIAENVITVKNALEVIVKIFWTFFAAAG